MTDCSTQLSMMDAAKQTLVTATPFSGKSKAIKMLDDSRFLAEQQLALAQEEFRQAVKHYKASKSQKLSQKQLARQDLCMRDAILLVHTEDPEMTLGELREKLMSNAVLALPKKLVVSNISKSSSKP
jgi:dihydroorotase-like cyclic amidohydrolase